MLTYSKRWPERAFDILNVLVLLALCIMTLYPFYNIVITSLNDPTDAARGGSPSGRACSPWRITKSCFRMNVWGMPFSSPSPGLLPEQQLRYCSQQPLLMVYPKPS